MYCERCSVVFEGHVCPQCGSKKVRAEVGADYCFLIEKEMIWGEMLAEVLRQNSIPFYQRNVFGAGLTLNVGSYLERYKFFVPYAYLSEAQNLVDVLFSSTD